MGARIATDLWLSALRRRCSAAGVMVTVLARGDATAGAVTLAARGRDGAIRLVHATTLADGQRGWMRGGATPLDDAGLLALVTRTRQRDPDAWIVEIETDRLDDWLDGPLIG